MAVAATRSSAATDKPTGTATLWVRDSAKGFINLLAEQYNKTHDGKVKVTIVPSANFVQKFGTAAASGSGPDIASIDLVYLPYFASKGVLDDLTPRPRLADLEGRPQPGAQEARRLRGQDLRASVHR